MVHHQNIEKYRGSLPQLAEDIGNLKYDALADFLHLLSVKIESDAASDKARGRVQLASSLQNCSNHLAKAATQIEQAWHISEPYMTTAPIEQAEQKSTQNQLLGHHNPTCNLQK